MLSRNKPGTGNVKEKNRCVFRHINLFGMLNFRCVAQCRFLSNYPLPGSILAFEKAPKLVNDSPSARECRLQGPDVPFEEEVF
jgi:hypothetical protein